MKKVCITVLATFALSGCSAYKGLTPAQKIDLTCVRAVKIAQTVGQVADIAAQYGFHEKEANDIADAAATGVDVAPVICGVAQSVVPAL